MRSPGSKGFLVVPLICTISIIAFGSFAAVPAVQDELPQHAVARFGDGPGGHSGAIRALAWVPDQKHIATADAGMPPAVRVWEVSGQRVVFTDAAHRPGQAQALSFHPEGKVLAAGYGQKVILWELDTGKPLLTLPAHADRNLALQFSLDGSTLASAGGDGSVIVWDAATGKQRLSFRVENGNASAVAISANLRWAASAEELKDVIQIWDLRTGKLTKSLKRGAQGNICLAFSPDERTLVELSDVYMAWWELSASQHRLAGFLPPPAFVKSLSYSPDSRHLALAGQKPLFPDANPPDVRVPVHLWSVPRLAIAFPLGHHDPVNAVDFSADGRFLASGGSDGRIMIWDVSSVERRFPKASPDANQAAWEGLSGSAEKARPNLWHLIESTNSIDFIRKELRPAQAISDSRAIGLLVRDLDSDQFAVRSKAREELMRLGPDVLPKLRMSLALHPSAEVRRTLKQLVDDLEVRRLQRLRGVEVLELMRSRAAREHLEALSKGYTASELTIDAIESLARMRRRD